MTESIDIYKLKEFLGTKFEEGHDYEEYDYFYALREESWVVDEIPLFEGFKIDVEEFFGGEGQGDQYWIVLSLTKEDNVLYFFIDGWYASHYGGELDLDSLYQVYPVKKEINAWSKKEGELVEERNS